ncbi:F-box only protein 2-like isoform X2 [Hoplias malabaricus]|uniref:F-box only protein 2-like isoform X2 n=1 Tax=Hoplias malabaricus TaxID=27720 RepID=UPI0034630069
MANKNLLKNPNGDDGLKYWELIKNGGDRWKVEDMPGDCGPAFIDKTVTKYFTTSYQMCLKQQVVDLLEEGLTAEELDRGSPVTVEDWYCSRSDCGCVYQLTVHLLDKNKEVIENFKKERLEIDPETDGCLWRQVQHTFTEYGQGLRFISFEHGGKDTKFWSGWYGVRVTASSIFLEL